MKPTFSFTLTVFLSTMVHTVTFIVPLVSMVICVGTYLYPQVQRLVEMGFPEALVRSTLESVGGDENMALEKLCSG